MRFTSRILVLLLIAAVCPRTRADDAAKSALERDSKGWTDLLSQAGAKLEGWTRGPIPSTGKLKDHSQWTLDKDAGILVCEGDGGHEWLRWDDEMADCIFHVEWRFTVVPGKRGYNSGIYARNSADARVWHQAQTGDGSGGFLFGDTLVNGATKRFNLSKQQAQLAGQTGRRVEHLRNYLSRPRHDPLGQRSRDE